jgi:DNA-binding SARP family transcriptional activator/tetratricopeptide (TPR) repeat protein
VSSPPTERVSATLLEIRLLGELEVVRSGRSLELPRSRKSRALLGYLAAIGKPEQRERLCDLFWDGPDDPRAALRWSLTKLRPILDEPGIARLIADRSRVAVDATAVSIDVQNARAAIADQPISTDRLREIASAFRGGFLSGLDLPDCYAYSAWLSTEREAARALHIAVLDALVDRLRDDPEAALPFARARVAAEPFDETGYAAVIELLSALGRTRDARAEYETCCRVLERELGRRPSPRVDRALSRSETVDRPTRLTRAATTASLVGRAREIDILHDMVHSDPGGVLLITGEPGIGKSRLLEELGRMVRAAGGAVLTGRAFEAEMVRPYGPWIDALRSPSEGSLMQHASGAALADLATLLPELAESSPGAAIGRERLFEAVAGVLSSMAKRSGLLAVVLDDLQWFDDASVALLHYVARRFVPAAGQHPAGRLILGLTARPASLASNATAAGFVRGRRREGDVHEMSLGPLAAGEVEQLVASLDRALDGARVAQASEGNPLFALEIARTLRSGETGVPATIEALVDDNLAHLEPLARDVVTWAAALGGRFDVPLLARAAGIAATELLPAIDALERHGIFRQTPHGEAYDFGHDLVRRVAYDRLSSPRARVVHAEIARRLSALDDPTGALAGDIAHHAILGGDAELAATSCARAGARCLRMFAVHEATALAARGLEAVRRATELPPRRRIPLAVALYEVLVHADPSGDRGHETQSALERLADEARSLGLYGQMQTLFYLISYIHYHGGEWARAEEDTLRAVEAGRSADAQTAARALANSGRCLASIEREPVRARELLHEASLRAGELGLDLVDLAWGLGILAHHQGDLDVAAAHLRHAVELTRAEEAHWPVCDCLVRLACLELERGRFAAVRAYGDELAPVAAKLGDASEGPFGEALAALAELSVAPNENATARFDAALRALAECDAKGARAYSLVAAAELDLTRGELDRARRRATEALDASRATGRRSETAMAQILLARLDLAHERDAEATTWLDTVAVEAARPFSLSARALRAYQVARAELEDGR